MGTDSFELRKKIGRHLRDLQAQQVLELRQRDQHRNAVGKTHHNADRHITHEGAQLEQPQEEKQYAGAGRGDQQIWQAVTFDDAVDDHDESAGRATNLHGRAAQQRNQPAGNDGGPDSRLGAQARGDRKIHGQRQGHDSHGQAGANVFAETFARVVGQC